MRAYEVRMTVINRWISDTNKDQWLDQCLWGKDHHDRLMDQWSDKINSQINAYKVRISWSTDGSIIHIRINSQINDTVKAQHILCNKWDITCVIVKTMLIVIITLTQWSWSHPLLSYKLWPPLVITFDAQTILLHHNGMIIQFC